MSGDFLIAYENVSDPIKIFGYPITDAYINHTTNRLVQYFQRAHFELHPEKPPELRVHMSYLGEIMYTPGTVLPGPHNHPACSYFSETDHQVCYAFLDFFVANGGIAHFGYPISDIELRNERMSQCFQRACFEWRPELPPGQRVILADLGRLYFEARDEDPSLLLPSKGAFIPKTILELKVRAFPTSAVLPVNGKQTIFVIVQDQNLQPVSNAQVILTVDAPAGEEALFIMPATNRHGITSKPIEFDGASYGIVQISVSASYDIYEVQTRTSFRIWW